MLFLQATAKPLSEVDLLAAELKRKEAELLELKNKQLAIELEKIKQTIREQEKVIIDEPLINGTFQLHGASVFPDGALKYQEVGTIEIGVYT